MNSPELFVANFYQWAIAFYNSTYFIVIKFVIGIYTAILIIDIVLMLIQRGIPGDVRDTWVGMNIPSEMVTKSGKARLKKKWNKIEAKLDSKDPNQYKVAIIEADRLVDSYLRRIGFSGENMTDRLEAVPLGQMEIAPQLLEAHKVHNRIIHEENFQLTKEEAKKTLALYAEFFKYHMVIK
jgi:hypothetical protein